MEAERGENPVARATGRRLVQLAALAAMVVLAAVLLGCGSDDNGSSDENGDGGEFAPNVVTTEDIEAQEQGSPGRGLLEWWQAFQFQDAPATIALTSENTLDDIGENTMEELVKTRGQGLQGVEVLDATESGDSASVRAGLLTFEPEEEGAEPPTEPTSSTPITFTMEKDGDQWLFDTPTYLEPMVENLKAAEQAAEEEPPAEEETTTTEE